MFNKLIFHIGWILAISTVIASCNRGKTSERVSRNAILGDTTFFESDNKVDSFYTSKARRGRFKERAKFVAVYNRVGDKWLLREATITEQGDTLSSRVGEAILMDNLKPLKRTFYNEVTGDTTIESWNYHYKVDSLKDWNAGNLYVVSLKKRFFDEGFTYYGTDTIAIDFISLPNSLSIKWSNDVNMVGTRDYVSILKANKEMGVFNRIERHGIFSSSEPQQYHFVTQYYDQWENTAFQYITFYDLANHPLRGGELYFPDEKSIKQVDSLINPNDLTISEFRGLLHGLWTYYATSESGTEMILDTKAFFEGHLVGNTKDDFLSAKGKRSEQITREIMGSSNSQTALGEKCSWCKVGRYVNGTCNTCGTVSKEREQELKGQSNRISKQIEECPYRSTHYKYEFPYFCSCGYVGK